jgi:two-component system, OmpR family, sensor kinase
MGPAGLHTPSLRVRVIAAGMLAWLVLVLVLDVFVFLSLRSQLLDSLDELLDARATLAQELGADLTAEDLDARLTRLGVPALVYAADGRRLTADPAVPGFGQSPPGPVDPPSGALAERTVTLPSGVSVTVLASRSGVERTLDQVLLFEAIGSIGVLSLMLVLLVRMSRVLLEPIDHVVATAQRIAGGRTGERLRPDRPDTELGRMAVAFDHMLDSLERAVDQAQAAEQEARDAEAGTRRFLADAAHQLRTPVAGLRVLIDSVLRTERPEERERLLSKLAQESSRLGSLVTSLLKVARLDRGDAPTLTRHDLITVVEEEVARARDFAPGLEIVHEAAVTGGEADVDVDEIRNALTNLLDNARRHALSRVTVTTTHRDGTFEVVVADDGPGLPEGGEARAFDRFVTLDGRGGSGLGLPIARGIARAHGGDLDYRSGAFVLSLPAATTGPRPSRSGTPT